MHESNTPPSALLNEINGNFAEFIHNYSPQPMKPTAKGTDPHEPRMRGLIRIYAFCPLQWHLDQVDSWGCNLPRRGHLIELVQAPWLAKTFTQPCLSVHVEIFTPGKYTRLGHWCLRAVCVVCVSVLFGGCNARAVAFEGGLHQLNGSTKPKVVYAKQEESGNGKPGLY